MKKTIFISAVIILLGLASYVFVAQKSANRESVQPASQKAAESPAQPSSSPATVIEINDNLDQALQDLGQIE